MHLSEHLHMGGYAAYVWPAVGMALWVLGWNFFYARHKERNIKKSIRDRK